MEGYEVIKPDFGKSTILAKRKKDGNEFVIKQIEYGSIDKSKKQNLIDRINAFVGLTRQDCIIARLYNPFVENSIINLPNKYFGDYTIASKIKECIAKRTHIPESFIFNVIGKICMELYEFHQANLGHMGITADHIFITGDSIKLTGINFTQFEIAPKEQIQKDLYQLGALIFEMATLSSFENDRHPEKRLASCSEEIRRLVIGLTNPNPEKQTDIVQVLSQSDIAVVVLEVKLEREKAEYEREKQIVSELESQVATYKKRAEQISGKM